MFMAESRLKIGDLQEQSAMLDETLSAKYSCSCVNESQGAVNEKASIPVHPTPDLLLGFIASVELALDVTGRL